MKANHRPTRAPIFNAATIIMVVGIGLLFGCGEDEERVNEPLPTLPTGNVTGEITLPASAQGKQLYVLIDDDSDGEEYVSLAGCTCSLGTVYEYSFTNCPIGAYYVYAIVYTDEIHQGGPEPGDYFGYYGAGLEPPPHANVVILSNQTRTCDFDLHVYTE